MDGITGAVSPTLALSLIISPTFNESVSANTPTLSSLDAKVISMLEFTILTKPLPVSF